MRPPPSGSPLLKEPLFVRRGGGAGIIPVELNISSSYVSLLSASCPSWWWSPVYSSLSLLSLIKSPTSSSFCLVYRHNFVATFTSLSVAARVGRQCDATAKPTPDMTHATPARPAG